MNYESKTFKRGALPTLIIVTILGIAMLTMLVTAYVGFYQQVSAEYAMGETAKRAFYLLMTNLNPTAVHTLFVGGISLTLFGASMLFYMWWEHHKNK